MELSPYILLIMTNLFYSFNTVIGKIVTGVIPPITLTFLRWLGSLIILLPFCWCDIKNNKQAFLAKWSLILVLGATGYGLASTWVYESVHYSTTINCSIINSFMPIMVAVMGYVLYREGVARLQVFGFALSLIGVIWIIFQGNWMHLIRLKANIGDLFMVVNLFTWSFYPVLFKHKATGLPKLAMLALLMFAGMLITIPPAIVENIIYHGSWLHQIRLVHLLSLVGLWIFPSILANQFQNIALKHVSANKAGIFQYLIPVFVTIAAVLFLGEKLHLYHIFGGLLIFAGVLLVIRHGPEENKSAV
jgi:drug/metabolite transporter (DMT)-like permease